jgi:transcriptional regulator with XRE-family HTH domain
MLTLGDQLDAAIRASGKTRAQVASEAGTTVAVLSRIITGTHENPGLDLLERIAGTVNSTPAALLGGSLSAADERELLHFRGWIDDKLMTVDSRKEPNASIVRSQAAAPRRHDRVADSPAKSVRRSTTLSMRTFISSSKRMAAP